MIGTLDLLTPNTQNWPYWTPPSVQLDYLIAGEQNQTKLEDIGINQIPMQAEYNNNDLRILPFIQSPQQQITDSENLQASSVIYGVGSASQSLTDILIQSVNETNAQAGKAA